MLMSKRIILMLAVAGLLIVSMAPASAKGPEARCYGVQGTGETSVVGPGVFGGTATLRLGGQLIEGIAVEVTSDGGPTSSHTFVFPSDADLHPGVVIKTNDDVILRPTDIANVMSLRSRLQVVEGDSGNFHLLPSSTLTFDPDTGWPQSAAWVLRGHICFGD